MYKLYWTTFHLTMWQQLIDFYQVTEISKKANVYKKQRLYLKVVYQLTL